MSVSRRFVSLILFMVTDRSIALPGVLYGDGFDCKVEVTLRLYRIGHPAPSQSNPEGSVAGMQRRESSLILDDHEDAGKELRLAQSSALREPLRLEFDMPAYRTWDCELVRWEGPYRRWKVYVTPRQR